MINWQRVGAIAVAAAGAAVVASASFAGTTAPTKVVAFTGNYSGNAVAQVQDTIANLTANGTGTATLLGAGKITGVGTATAKEPCSPFLGTGTITGKGGTLLFKVVNGSQGCGDEDGKVFSVTGTIAVTKGTGKFAKAKGTLRMTGMFDRGAGKFSIKFTGKLAV
jgi:hypothetical protein